MDRTNKQFLETKEKVYKDRLESLKREVKEIHQGNLLFSTWKYI